MYYRISAPNPNEFITLYADLVWNARKLNE